MAKHRRLFGAPAAWVFAVVGVGLMALTLHWRINPVDGSSAPSFLTGTGWGRVVMMVLFVTCMPIWIVAQRLFYIVMEGRISDAQLWRCTQVGMLVLQAVLYFCIGTVVSRLVGWARRTTKGGGL